MKADDDAGVPSPVSCVSNVNWMPLSVLFSLRVSHSLFSLLPANDNSPLPPNIFPALVN